MRRILFSLVLAALVLAFVFALPFAFAQYPVAITPYQIVDTRSGQGVPCAGCLLYTYSAGTNTPLATYNDYTLGTPNANPIVLNSAGYATTGIWVGSGCYKFILKDAGAVNIWTQDHICDGNAVVTALLSGATGATLVGYKAVQTSSTLRTVGSKLNETYSLVDAGCVADSGSTDNSTCIASAIAYAQASNASLLCPNTNGGYFGVSTPISVTITTQFDFYGEGPLGCNINWTGTATSDPTVKMLTFVASGGSGVSNYPFSLLNMNFGAVNAAGTLLDLDGINNFKIDNVNFSPAAATVNALLCRSCQSGSINARVPAPESGIVTNAIQFTMLANPAITSATTTITGSIGPSTSSFGVGSCAAFVDQFTTVAVIGSEVIRPLSCVSTTLTVASDCGATGTPGHNLCRGDEVTTAASHSSGAILTWAYPVVSDDVSCYNCETYSTTAGILMDSGPLSRITVYGGHHDENAYGVLNISGSFTGHSAHTESGLTGYYQNNANNQANGECYSCDLTAVNNAIDIESGSFKMYGGDTQGGNTLLGSGAAHSQLVGVVLATASYNFNETDLSCWGSYFAVGSPPTGYTSNCNRIIQADGGIIYTSPSSVVRTTPRDNPIDYWVDPTVAAGSTTYFSMQAVSNDVTGGTVKFGIKAAPADSGLTNVFNLLPLGASSGTIQIPGQASLSGLRYLCISTAGTVFSSASACSGT